MWQHLGDLVKDQDRIRFCTDTKQKNGPYPKEATLGKWGLFMETGFEVSVAFTILCWVQSFIYQCSEGDPYHPPPNGPALGIRHGLLGREEQTVFCFLQRSMWGNPMGISH